VAALRDEVTESQSIFELREALKRAMTEKAKLKHRNEEMVRAIYQAAKDAAMSMPPVKVKPPTKDTRKGKPEVAVIHCTDWQLGKRTVSYGSETCGKRIERFIDKCLHITEIQRKHHPVKEAVLMLGGDMVEGLGIFPGQIYEVDSLLYEQLFEVSRLISQTITTLASNFESVRVVCEYGNHGRIGRYGEMPKGDNIDRISYEIARTRVGHLVKEWQSSDAWYQIIHIGNYKALLVHGDEVKSFGGNTPAFGILRKVNAWAGGVIEPFSDCYMGHWHTPMSLTMSNGGRIYVTGSPESHNEYAREFVAATGIPSQRLHFVDPDKGRVAAEYVVWLD
jgi:hypothetical protein